MQQDPSVYINHNGQTAIFLRPDPDDKDLVQLIPQVVSGFSIKKMPAKDFKKQYERMPGYPTERAARLYVSFAQSSGATKEVMAELGELTSISKAEHNTAASVKFH